MQKEINKILGERVKECRKNKGYTREAFAETISVSTRFLADVESGKVGVSISTLKNMALELNVMSDYLIGISSAENSEDLIRNGIISKIKLIDSKYLKDIDTILDCIISIAKK
ncbi:MAG: helix-turn-helix domain-containing protein [Lachnospiraceae bacterium]|nr:helix-turn-helix domain-containing protein [Lachnospiraceae bacterium]